MTSLNQPIEISNCCSSAVINPSCDGNEGICADCKEHCGIVRSIFVKVIKSEYPLGTQNGIDYHIYPSETR